jgi:hypothetical protein
MLVVGVETSRSHHAQIQCRRTDSPDITDHREHLRQQCRLRGTAWRFVTEARSQQRHRQVRGLAAPQASAHAASDHVCAQTHAG